MNITLTISDTQKDLIIQAFCDTQGYIETIPDPNDETKIIPNPETKPMFAKRMLGEYVRTIVRMYERKKQEQAIVFTEIDIT